MSSSYALVTILDEIGRWRERHERDAAATMEEIELEQVAARQALEEAQRRLAAAEKAEKEAAERAEETAQLLSRTVLTIHHRAGEDGKLFGSVGPRDIADAIKAARDLKVDHRKIRLEQPIHEIGTHMVEVEVGGVTASVKTIVAEEK